MTPGLAAAATIGPSPAAGGGAQKAQQAGLTRAAHLRTRLSHRLEVLDPATFRPSVSGATALHAAIEQDREQAEAIVRCLRLGSELCTGRSHEDTVACEIGQNLRRSAVLARLLEAAGNALGESPTPTGAGTCRRFLIAACDVVDDMLTVPLLIRPLLRIVREPGWDGSCGPLSDWPRPVDCSAWSEHATPPLTRTRRRRRPSSAGPPTGTPSVPAPRTGRPRCGSASVD